MPPARLVVLTHVVQFQGFTPIAEALKNILLCSQGFDAEPTTGPGYCELY